MADGTLSLAKAEPRTLAATHTSTRGRIPTLDGLRAIAILLVILGHLTGTRNYPAAMGFLGEFANFGVRVFFVLSGFLITSLLLKELAKAGDVSLKDFYLRRVYRIFPAFYVYFILVATLSLLSIVHLGQHDLAYAFVYLINFHFPHSWYVAHLWSLSVEEQFYLLWPAVIALFTRKTAIRVAAAVMFLAPIFRVAFYYFIPGLREGVGQMFPTIADALAVGCLLALCRDWLHRRTWYLKLVAPRLFWLLILIAVAGNVAQEHPRIALPLGESIMDVTLALIIDHCMLFSAGIVGNILEWKPIAFVGVLSYSLYIWQQPFLNRASDQVWTRFPLNVICVCAAAFASYYLVERPFLRLKETLHTRRLVALTPSSLGTTNA
jgi:peptidoglycan/LPS O-acetylase OafA/YrhL